MVEASWVTSQSQELTLCTGVTMTEVTTMAEAEFQTAGTLKDAFVKI